MKTHDLADALIVLAQIIKAGPNLDLNVWTAARPSNSGRLDAETAHLSPRLLAALARVSKEEWKQLLDEWCLPVPVTAANSVRDLVGNVLRYLEQNPDAARKAEKKVARKNKKMASQLFRPPS